ncbi:uncharacterized protein LOC135111954 [Scylla paramamosain]|uniref:uncharacterized protein LOC135111954 n=1 Tax=Scylla paramamosain TaxID=85552 RepID=UPI00308300CD
MAQWDRVLWGPSGHQAHGFESWLRSEVAGNWYQRHWCTCQASHGKNKTPTTPTDSGEGKYKPINGAQSPSQAPTSPISPAPNVTPSFQPPAAPQPGGGGGGGGGVSLTHTAPPSQKEAGRKSKELVVVAGGKDSRSSSRDTASLSPEPSGPTRAPKLSSNPIMPRTEKPFDSKCSVMCTCIYLFYFPTWPCGHPKVLCVFVSGYYYCYVFRKSGQGQTISVKKSNLNLLPPKKKGKKRKKKLED